MSIKNKFKKYFKKRDGGDRSGARKSGEGDGDDIIQGSVDLDKDFGIHPKNNGKLLTGFKKDVINFSLSKDQFGLEGSKGGCEETSPIAQPS